MLKCEILNKNRPQRITEAKKATILRNLAIQTDRKIKSNRPAIMGNYNKRKSCFLIEMSLSADNNI